MSKAPPSLKHSTASFYGAFAPLTSSGKSLIRQASLHKGTVERMNSKGLLDHNAATHIKVKSTARPEDLIASSEGDAILNLSPETLKASGITLDVPTTPTPSVPVPKSPTPSVPVPKSPAPSVPVPKEAPPSPSTSSKSSETKSDSKTEIPKSPAPEIPVPASPAPTTPVPKDEPPKIPSGDSSGNILTAGEPISIESLEEKRTIAYSHGDEVDEFTTRLIIEIETLRADPHYFIPRMERRAEQYEGDVYRTDGVAIKTHEGAEAVKDAKAFLKKQSDVGGLIAVEALCRAAADAVKEVGEKGSTAPADSITKYLPKYGSYSGVAFEMATFGTASAEQVIEQLLVDDGDKERRKRNALFNKKIKYLGAAHGKHNSDWKSMCLLIFVEDWTDKEAS